MMARRPAGSSQFVCWRDGIPVYGHRRGWQHKLNGRTGAIPRSRRHYPVPVLRSLFEEAFSMRVSRARFLEIKEEADQLDDFMQQAHGFPVRPRPE